jgi:hypothetical protein
MTLLTRSVTNTSSTTSLPLFVPGYDTNNPVLVAPSATLDLLSVMSSETLHAMQGQLNALVADGSITVAAQIQSSSLWPAAGFAYVMSSDTQVVFNPTAISGTHTAGATVAVQIENAAGAIDIYDSSTTVTVAASGTGTPLLNGFASPHTFTVSSGVASILVTDSAADTVTLSISAVSRTLTHSSTSTVTLS